MVLAYFGVEISERLIARACNASPASGTTGTDLVKGAQRLGLKAQIIDRASFATIGKWLRRGVPVIVDWMSTVASRPTRTSMACGHYSVVYGLNQKDILLQDPAVGPRRISRNKFLTVWFDFQDVFPQHTRDLIIRRVIVAAPKIGSAPRARNTGDAGIKGSRQRTTSVRRARPTMQSYSREFLPALVVRPGTFQSRP